MCIWSLNNRVKFRTKIPMHCCNINKSRRGRIFFLVHLVCVLVAAACNNYSSLFITTWWTYCSSWSCKLLQLGLLLYQWKSVLTAFKLCFCVELNFVLHITWSNVYEKLLLVLDIRGWASGSASSLWTTTSQVFKRAPWRLLKDWLTLVIWKVADKQLSCVAVGVVFVENKVNKVW